MAVSGKTAAPIEAPYFVDGDKPPHMGTVTKAQADRLHALLEAVAVDDVLDGTAASGQILIAQPGDVARFKAMSGDVSIDKDGATQIGAGVVTDAEVAAANKDGATGTVSMRTLGTGAKQAAAGNDSRLSDERVPLAGTVTRAKLNAGLIQTKRATEIAEMVEGEIKLGIILLWPVEFADVNYTVSLACRTATALATVEMVIIEKTKAQIKVNVRNSAGMKIAALIVEAIAIHD